MTLIWTILLVVLATLIGSVGSLYLKKGSAKVSRNPLNWVFNAKLILGVFLYVFSSVFFISALKYGELSVLYPITSLAYIWVSLLSIKYLNEKMNKYKWTGIALIILGVVVIGLAA